MGGLLRSESVVSTFAFYCCPILLPRWCAQTNIRPDSRCSRMLFTANPSSRLLVFIRPVLRRCWLRRHHGDDRSSSAPSRPYVLCHIVRATRRNNRDIATLQWGGRSRSLCWHSLRSQVDLRPSSRASQQWQPARQHPAGKLGIELLYNVTSAGLDRSRHVSLYATRLKSIGCQSEDRP